MLGGFLAAMAATAPEASFTLASPFPLAPMRRRFPQIEWLACTPEARAAAIAACDAWVGLGGSPFQSAQSRWFVDHLVEESAWCARAAKPMYFLGVGVQEERELQVPEVQVVCAQAAAIWTRDQASARRLAALVPPARVRPAADLAQVLLAAWSPAPLQPGAVTVVLNFDHREEWDASTVTRAVAALAPRDRIWLAQESRLLPGGEKALHGSLPAEEQKRWHLREADRPEAPLSDVLAHWPSSEWLVTSRFHAAMAGAWAGSRVLVYVTNEKLHGVADELGLAAVPAGADAATIEQALRSSAPAPRPLAPAETARASVRELVSAIRGQTRA